MGQTAVTHGVPEFIEDLPRHFVPFDASEKDWKIPNGSGTVRLRMIRFKRLDQNGLHTLVKNLGPGTGEDGVYIPCEGANDMAHINELLDDALRRRKERKLQRSQLLPIRHAQLQTQLINYAEEAMLQKAGLSTFGPYQRTERVSY